MNKILQKTLHTGICLSIGISIGLNSTDDISITNVHDGEFTNSQTEFYDNMIKDVDTIEI